MSRSLFLGSTFIVAGTSIGAGMLALPMSSFTLGWQVTLLLLIALWGFTTLTGIVQVQLNEVFQKPLSIVLIVRQLLGRWAEVIAQCSLLLLFYALLVAYTTGASRILAKTELMPQWGFSCVYIALFGGIVALHHCFTDYANRILFICKVIIFVGMVGLFLPLLSQKGFEKVLFPVTTQNWIQDLALATPIFFTSFGFHGSLPSLFSYVRQDALTLKKSLFLGSLIALVAYVIWVFTSLGLALTESNALTILKSHDLGVFVQHLTNITETPFLDFLVSSFVFLAITTSFLGVSMGLFDYVQEQIMRIFHRSSKGIVLILTFFPPLAFSIFYSNGFIQALRYAAIFLSFLAVIFPCLSAIVLEYRSTQRCTFKIILYLLAILLGFGIIMIEFFK